MEQDTHSAGVEQQIIEFYSLIGHQIEHMITREDRASDFIIRAKDGEKRVTRCELRDEVDDTHVKALYKVMRKERAGQAALITTGILSAKAQQFAKGKPIRLVDWSEFESLLLRARTQAEKRAHISSVSPIEPETLKLRAKADTPLAKQHDKVQNTVNQFRLPFASRGWHISNTGVRLIAFVVPVLVGLATLWVAIYPVLAIIDLVQGVAGAYAGQLGYYTYRSPILSPFMASLVRSSSVLCITAVLYSTLVVFYIRHLFRNTGFSAVACVIWGIGVAVMPIIAMPACFLIYIDSRG